jgi:hypothetical protein
MQSLHTLASEAWQRLRDQAPRDGKARQEANAVCDLLLEGGPLWLTNRPPEHTGIAADWCDICGACTCKRAADVEEPTGEQLISWCEGLDSACPLHGDNSTHEPADEQQTTAPAWIDVGERLPEHDQPVLARFEPVEPCHDAQPPFEVCVAAYDASKAAAHAEADARLPKPPRHIPPCNWYRYAASGDVVHYFTATHWMPLPEPPPCTEHRCYRPDGCTSCGPGTES